MANTFLTFLAECGEVSVICCGTFRTRPANPRPDIHPHPRRMPFMRISLKKVVNNFACPEIITNFVSSDSTDSLHTGLMIFIVSLQFYIIAEGLSHYTSIHFELSPERYPPAPARNADYVDIPQEKSNFFCVYRKSHYLCYRNRHGEFGKG